MVKINHNLKHFLSEALVKSKRERFIGFLSSPKGQLKFCQALNHDLERYLDSMKLTSKFSESELKQEGYLYCSHGVANDNDDSMINLYGKAPWEGGWLLLNKLGTIAIYRPEGRIDDELYIKL